MSQFNLSGAVDLSGLQRRPAGAPAQGATPPSSPANPPATLAGLTASGPTGGLDEQLRDALAGSGGLAIPVTADGFSEVVNASLRYPIIMTIWSSAQPASAEPVLEWVESVRRQAGRAQLAVADLETDPEIAQAFMQIAQQAQIQGGVTALAFIQGQPMPIPPSAPGTYGQMLEKILELAVQQGLAGRVPGDFAAAEPEEVFSPLHDEALDAIERGDFEAALAAYDQILADDPKDAYAVAGRGQVLLLQRTQGVDLQAAREAAAENPTDVAAQTVVADLDLAGGHVEDAFDRLIELVAATSEDDRNQARQHLLGLFDLVGPSDPRVKVARTKLMSVLY